MSSKQLRNKLCHDPPPRQKPQSRFALPLEESWLYTQISSAKRRQNDHNDWSANQTHLLFRQLRT